MIGICASQTNEGNYGELLKLKLILWGTAVPIHNMTALPAKKTPDDKETDLVSTDSETILYFHSRVDVPASSVSGNNKISSSFRTERNYDHNAFMRRSDKDNIPHNLEWRITISDVATPTLPFLYPDFVPTLLLATLMSQQIIRFEYLGTTNFERDFLHPC